jgi:hypothetical protein
MLFNSHPAGEYFSLFACESIEEELRLLPNLSRE